MRTLDSIKSSDADYKPMAWEADWEAQRDLYHDRARALVSNRLRQLKLGIRDDMQPIESSLLRYVVDSLAVAYRSPPTRWLVRGGRRLPEDAPEYEALRDAMRRSNYDAVLRTVDRDRTLYRQVIIRLYPDDRNRRVKLVPYSPLDVYRAPSPYEPEDVRADHGVAVRLLSDPLEGTRELWEVWSRDGDTWSMSMVDRLGQLRPREEQPMGELDLMSPYPTLPLVVAYDDLATTAWLAPRSSRTSYPLAIASTWNEVMAGIRWDSHPEVVYEQTAQLAGQGVRPSDMPKQTGAGIRALLPPNVQARLLNISPQVQGMLLAIEGLVESFLHSESLPTDAFRQSQTVTALGLRTLAQPLRERQESLRPYVLETERRLMAAYVAVHNVHADSWGVPRLPEDVELEVELGPIDVASDPREQSEALAREMALRLISPIDAIMAREQCDRATAIARYERIQSDWERYPVELSGAEQPDGPRMADPDPEEPNPDASVIDSVRAARDIPTA